MKKLFFIAALLLVTTLCSCYAPSYSSTEPTPTRPDLDLPLPEETEPYIPPVSGKWEHDPNPYDEIKIYGGMCGDGTAVISLENDLATVTLEAVSIIDSGENEASKTTYVVSGLSLLPERDPKNGAYVLFAETYTVSARLDAGVSISYADIANADAEIAIDVVVPSNLVVYEGQNLSISVNLDDENGVCTVNSISCEDKTEGQIYAEYEYVRGYAYKTYFSSKNLKVELVYRSKDDQLMKKTVSTYNDEGKRTHVLCKSWYANGVLKSVQEATTGGAYDYAVYYHENGNIKSETHLESLRENSMHYNEDGVLTSKKYYDGDYLHEISYYDDGETVFKEQIDVIDNDYINSLFTVSIKYWYKNGALQSEKVNVKNGKSHFKAYFEDGRLQREVRYTKTGGTEYEIAYYEDGTLQCEIDNVNKTKYIHEIIPYPDGRPDRIRITVNGVTTTTDYYENGVKSYEYICIPELDEDYTKEWYENGVLKCEDNWVNGVHDTIEYYENGNVRYVTKDTGAKRESTHYYANGVVKSVYIHTARVRTLTEYDENGKKIRYTHTDCEPDGTILNKYVEEFE